MGCPRAAAAAKTPSGRFNQSDDEAHCACSLVAGTQDIRPVLDLMDDERELVVSTPFIGTATIYSLTLSCSRLTRQQPSWDGMDEA